MQKTIEAGVFIPVGSGGWMFSTNTPHTPGTYEHVLEVVQLAEKLGYGFVLSPAIWRGHKGPSKHWMSSLESLTTSAALLQATSRIHVWTTAHMTVYPPAIIAKMISTLDQIGPGRVGLNLVTGSSLLDLDHVGLWSDLGHDAKYELGDEWVEVAKRLWTEPVISHKGEHYELKEAVMGPKPSVPPFLINAGASPRGLRFAVENCDAAFVLLNEVPSDMAAVKLARKTAEDLNKPDFKIFGAVEIIAAETEEGAQAIVDHLNAGIDVECIADIAAGYSQNPHSKDTSKGSRVVGDDAKDAFADGTLIGSYESLARRLAHVVTETGVDGLMLIVPDYLNDLGNVASKILLAMEPYGVTCRLTPAE